MALTSEQRYVFNHPQVLKRRELLSGAKNIFGFNPANRFTDVDHSRDWLKRSGLYDPSQIEEDVPDTARGSRNINQLSAGELANEIKKIIATDRARLSNMPYVGYTGQTLAPMSSLTQRAEQLKQKRSEKGIPYRTKLNRLASAPIEGIDEGSISSILDQLRAKHLGFGQSKIGGRLSKQFGRAANPYMGQFQSELGEDTGLKLGEVRRNLQDLNPNIKDIEERRRKAAFDVVSGSALGKDARQRQLISNLEKYGTQKHGIINRQLTADKAKFEAERREPSDRLDNLQRALAAINADEMHPELSEQNAMALKKALEAYGVDVSKPVDQWSISDKTTTPVYGGKLTEPITPEMQSSYDLLENISPSYQDENYASRKALRRDLSDPTGLSSKAVMDLPERLRPAYDALDAEAKRKAKSDLTKLNAKYIKRGMYGGQSHINEVKDRLREINDASLKSRADSLRSGLLQGVTERAQEDISKARALSRQDQLANTEFGNVLGDIDQTNLSGLEKWRNEQLKNEQLYKSYLSEVGNRGSADLRRAKSSGFNEGALSAYDVITKPSGELNYNVPGQVDLSAISNLQGRYDNLQKELSTARDEIKTLGEYKNKVKAREAEELRANQQERDIERLAKERYAPNMKLMIDSQNSFLRDMYKQYPQMQVSLNPTANRNFRDLINKGTWEVKYPPAAKIDWDKKRRDSLAAFAELSSTARRGRPWAVSDAEQQWRWLVSDLRDKYGGPESKYDYLKHKYKYPFAGWE